MRSLASENFLATKESLRSFFAMGMGKAPEQKGEAMGVATYSGGRVQVSIKGMMLREKNIWTELGFATSTEQVAQEIKKALDANMEIDLVIDSGGGVVSGTSSLADLIAKNRDKITAYGKGMVASAAMWVYSAAGKRYAEDTTLMGSIGVVVSVFDDEEFWKSNGIVWKDIVSDNARNKRPDIKTAEGEAEVKRYLTSLENTFLSTVERNLGMTKGEVVANFREGGIVTGEDAFEFGAIHGIINANYTKSEETGMNPEEMEGKLSALRAELGDAQGAVQAKAEELEELSAKLSDTQGELGAAKEKIAAFEKASEENKEIIAMAFEHGCDKETTMSLLNMPKGDAAMKILEAKKSEGAAPKGDFQEKSDGTDEEIDAYYKEKRGSK